MHYRLVYKDVGLPLHYATNLADSFSAIYDTFIALALLYLALWVHRDISTGNIILVKRGDGTFRGKLSGLEYARDFEDKNREVARNGKRNKLIDVQACLEGIA